MKSVKDIFNSAKSTVNQNRTTLYVAAAFAAFHAVTGPSPVSYDNYDANVVSKAAIHAVSFAGNTGLIFGGFLLGGGLGRRLTAGKSMEMQQVGYIIGAGITASVASGFGGAIIDATSNALLADAGAGYEQHEQYAQVNTAAKGVTLEDGRTVTYDVKNNVLKIG